MVNTLRQQTQAAGGQLLDEAEDLYDIFLAVNNFDGPATVLPNYNPLLLDSNTFRAYFLIIARNRPVRSCWTAS